MLARGNENFRAPGEHRFSFFHVKLFTRSVSVLLTSQYSLKIIIKNHSKLVFFFFNFKTWIKAVGWMKV